LRRGVRIIQFLERQILEHRSFIDHDDLKEGNMIKLSIFLVTFLFGILAPAPPQIAFNPVTKECGVYWCGDEYADYAFPTPWETSNGLQIKAESRVYKWDGRMDSVKGICEQMGFTYIEGNLGPIKGEMQWGVLPWLYILIITVPIVLVVVLICIAFNLFLKFLVKRHNSNIS
jgi:hypothetical protein